MPIYAYRCESCGHAKDVMQKLADAPLAICPSCGADAFRKQLTAPAFQLKGSGWYVTDFRDGNKGKPAAPDEGPSDAGKGDAGKGDAASAGDAAKPDAAAKAAPAPAGAGAGDGGKAAGAAAPVTPAAPAARPGGAQSPPARRKPAEN